LTPQNHQPSVKEVPPLLHLTVLLDLLHEPSLEDVVESGSAKVSEIKFVCICMQLLVMTIQSEHMKCTELLFNPITPRLNPLAQDRQPRFFSGHLISNACS
jgi:hypothetical protein